MKIGNPKSGLKAPSQIVKMDSNVSKADSQTPRRNHSYSNVEL